MSEVTVKTAKTIKAELDAACKRYIQLAKDETTTMPVLAKARKEMDDKTEEYNNAVRAELYAKWAKAKKPVYTALKDGSETVYSIKLTTDKSGNLKDYEIVEKDRTADILLFAEAHKIKLPGDVVEAVRDFIYVAGAALALDIKAGDPATILDGYANAMSLAKRKREIDLKAHCEDRTIDEAFLQEYLQKVFDALLFDKDKDSKENKHKATIQDVRRCRRALSKVATKGVDKLNNTGRVLPVIIQAMTISLNNGEYRLQLGKDSIF